MNKDLRLSKVLQIVILAIILILISLNISQLRLLLLLIPVPFALIGTLSNLTNSIASLIIIFLALAYMIKPIQAMDIFINSIVPGLIIGIIAKKVIREKDSNKYEPIFMGSIVFIIAIIAYYFMYKYAFKIDILNENETELGGYKEISFMVTGKGAYSRLKFESGVHRVQRVPDTESSGRIHTSTATVAVLPVVEDVEIEINPADIKMEVFRASGAGGQHVNKTSSAVRLIHEPTGIVAECQTERSQLQNREYAMKMLRSKIYNIEKEKQDSEIANARKTQVGSGDRSEKIRTYNYPQGRITDHRIGMSIFQMENFLNGDLDEMIDNLSAADRAERLKGE